ncbi:hypothetical protein TTHERM_00133410 (macronuclear) [Tetrahymena thermophila SB210]|uniref:Uncharacterized protein n=1 Tax=Tetrahymena thermophila (strain SB210) TaxID=312017 RepID=I7M8N8_TETTS|nr:hypothetical protein TTHERM_00133410 [Tetrahymena thermophila SB210]EAR99375.1 hypothetical protein TTHERM_00133410 [Tetrahymena thermophila SB210]|eukprot:XP_001019620.1 hypothetical protein TTHERM_00133410 [Tetrahymena thermophila SB210]
MCSTTSQFTQNLIPSSDYQQYDLKVQSKNNANSQQNISLKGESIIDLGYFQFYKQTYKPKIHPNNHFLNVVSTKKSKHFVELHLQNSNRNKNFSNLFICEQLQEVCATKVTKASQLYYRLINDVNNDVNSDNLDIQHEFSQSSDIIQKEVFLNAESILNQRANNLFKFNLYYMTEDNQKFFLKHGISNSALSALKMSPDFYQYVHIRFGASPFVDRFYQKNFFEINFRLLDQSYSQNDYTTCQNKYVFNISSVGAIYGQAECETINLNNGFYLEIQYYQNESILTSQVSEINKKLRFQAQEYVYSSASQNFIQKYYPNKKTWQQSKLLEVDSDIVERLVKKRQLNMQNNNNQQLNQDSKSISQYSETSSYSSQYNECSQQLIKINYSQN